MKQKGLFIAIEGSDGVGKATQLELLASHLRQDGYEVETFSFPRYEEPSSYFVREYLAASYGSARHVSPYVGSLFYALDRYHSSSKIAEALSAGKIVLADRFTASNMAHQGSKLKQAEQRKGFYIWVDGVEAQMLGIPRPDKSIVLHLPPEVSRDLIAQEGKELDDHEKDTAAHKASTDTFEELCKLFPSDFTQIDCVRSGSILSKNQVHALVWGVVEPLLPDPSSQRNAIKPAHSDQTATLMHTQTADKHSAQAVAVSTLLSIKTGSKTFQAGDIEFFRPSFRDESLTKLWEKTMSRLRKLHDDVLSKLHMYLVTNNNEPEIQAADKAQLLASNLLPLATLRHIEIHKDLCVCDDLPEARDHNINITITKDSEFNKIARDFLPSNHGGAIKKPISLVSVWPRNELELLPEMLFEQSNLSIEELRNEVAGWPISRKQDALIAYVKEHRDDPNSVLSQYRYEFDMVCDTPTILELINAGAHVRTQEFTPRYGFDVPKLIEEADLTESYEEAFNTSMQLHSLMQSSNHPSEAQYATLLGHKQRYLVITSIAAPNIYRSYNKTIQTTCTMMREIILEHHNFILDFQDDQFVD